MPAAIRLGSVSRAIGRLLRTSRRVPPNPVGAVPFDRRRTGSDWAAGPVVGPSAKIIVMSSRVEEPA